MPSIPFTPGIPPQTPLSNWERLGTSSALSLLSVLSLGAAAAGFWLVTDWAVGEDGAVIGEPGFAVFSGALSESADTWLTRPNSNRVFPEPVSIIRIGFFHDNLILS